VKRMLATGWLLVFLALPAIAGAEKAAGLTGTKYVHPDARGKLAILGNVAVVITGTDPFINRVMEDVLAISLMAQGDDPLKLARSVAANALITGTLVTEPPGESRWRSVRVSIAALALVDVPQDKTLLWGLYEPEVATTTTRIAQDFAAMVVKELQ